MRHVVVVGNGHLAAQYIQYIRENPQTGYVVDGYLSAHRKEELDETLLAALDRIAKKANDGSAEHKFFIGLAYLNRIDVETDQELALELITEAAKDPEKPCMDATAKLVDMYFHGECVDANTEEAITWQKLLVSQYKSEYDRNHDPDEHKGYYPL